MRHVLAVAAILLAACSPEPTAMPAADASANSSQQTDIGAVVEAALSHPRVANFLHPEVAGRLPITVAVRSPSGISRLDAILFGRPVRLVPTSHGGSAVVLGISIKDDLATVALDYPLEGLIGDLVLQHNGAAWVVISVQLQERRSNNSFKPKPLRGSA